MGGWHPLQPVWTSTLGHCAAARRGVTPETFASPSPMCRRSAGGCQAARATWGSPGHSLQKAWLVLLFIVWPELDLALVAGKLAGFVKGDRVGTVKDVIASLNGKRRHCRRLGSHADLPPFPWDCPRRTCFPDRKEVDTKKRRIKGRAVPYRDHHHAWERNSSRTSGWFLPGRGDKGSPGELQTVYRAGLGFPGDNAPPVVAPGQNLSHQPCPWQRAGTGQRSLALWGAVPARRAG